MCRFTVILSTCILSLIAACADDAPKAWNWEPPVCQDGPNCCAPEDLICLGDPDKGTVCTCHNSWNCDDTWLPKKCSQTQPDTPDGTSGWTCGGNKEFEWCERKGNSAPDGKNGWNCKVEGENVICKRPPNTPDGTETWSCTYHNGTKECSKPTGGGVALPPKITKSGCSNSGAVPDMMILLDHSGSMGSLAGSSSKWSQAVSAVNGLVAAFDDEVRFGLMLFPAKGTSCDAGNVDVPIGGNSANAIAAALSAAPVGGGTPIASSLAGVPAAFTAATSPGNKYVLLVTDGGETCSQDPVTQVQTLLSAKIKTYVVGFGSAVSVAQLKAMATAGGTGAASYYQADNHAQLNLALEAIGNKTCK